MLTPPQSDLAGVVLSWLSEAQRDALTGAYELDGTLYHDGMTRTGAALFRRGLVTHDGALTGAGLSARAFLSAQSRTTGEKM